MQTQEAIKNRCSLKLHLSKKPVEPEKLEQVLEAARLAPSARNLQPWRFVVVQGDEAIEELVSGAFPESNQVLKNGSLLILICAREEDDVTSEGRPYYLFDAGLTVENLLLAATDLGLLTHPILMFDESEVKRILEIPDDYRVVLATPAGLPRRGELTTRRRRTSSANARESASARSPTTESGAHGDRSEWR